MQETVLFSTSTCPWRARAKRYLVEKGVSVREVNVERDRRHIDRALASRA